MAIGLWCVGECVCVSVLLIQEVTAASRPAVAVQLVVLILDGEFVVVGEFFAPVDLPQGEDDDVLTAVHVDDARVAVRLTGVVDETSCVALHCRVHHVKVIDAEHVAANALAVIIFLPFISQDRANDGAGVLDHHLPSLDVPFAEEATTVNLGPVNAYCFF